MEFPILTNFDKRVLNSLLDTANAGVDLAGRNGERAALDHLVAVGVDQTNLWEVQVKLGIVTHKARIQLGLGSHAAIEWGEAMELTLTQAKELREAGALAEDGPPPDQAETDRAVFGARDEAQRARFQHLTGGAS